MIKLDFIKKTYIQITMNRSLVWSDFLTHYTLLVTAEILASEIDAGDKIFVRILVLLID